MFTRITLRNFFSFTAITRSQLLRIAQIRARRFLFYYIMEPTRRS